MKKFKSMMIVLLSVMVAGCSNANSEQHDDNGIAVEQQTEEETRSTDTAKEKKRQL